jgi:TM2 domain-containing membrane protein YozV
VHRFYLGKWVTGLVWLLTGGLLGVGWIYDFFTLNEQLESA